MSDIEDECATHLVKKNVISSKITEIDADLNNFEFVTSSEKCR